MNLSNIKVSVVTPTYNDEKYIEETIKSILGQTHKNLEVLIVDDCSTDKTAEIIKSFNDPRIRFFQNEKNSGAAFSRNVALKAATGEYVAFLDGDDVWDLTKIEAQLSFMIENNYVFSCTDYYIIDDDGNKTGKYVTGPKRITHRKFMHIDYIGCLTAIYKREIIPDLQVPTAILKRNDDALWLKVSEKADCYYLKEKLAFYRKRMRNSISSGSKKRLFDYHVLLYRELYGYSKIRSVFCSLRNVFYFYLKKIIYIKDIKEE